jgi:Carboxypeptidase regulatory-like domain/Domain of unknown function (DUF4214)
MRYSTHSSARLAGRLVILVALALFIDGLPLASLARSSVRIGQRSQRSTHRQANSNSTETKGAQQVSAASVVPAASAIVDMTRLSRRNAQSPASIRAPKAIDKPLPGPDEDSIVVGPSQEAAANLQTRPLSPAAAPPATTLTFQGMNDINDVIPPDTNGSVGASHVVTATNSRVRTHSKATGAPLTTVNEDGPGGFWTPILPVSSGGITDPHMVYDPFNNRWIFTVVSDPQNANSSVCVAVTATSDPTGVWNMFRFDVDAAETLWADYPMLGFNKDWIVVSLNMFTISSDTFSRGQVYAFNKANLYANNSAGMSVFTSAAIPFSLQPAVTYDNTIDTVYMIRHVSSSGGAERKSTLAGTPPATPTLTIDTAVVTSVLGGWSVPTGEFLPQAPEPTPGAGTAGVDVGDARVLNAVVRTIGANTSLYFSQNITLPSGGSPNHAAAQWWEVDASSGSTTTVRQQGRIEESSATQSNGGFHFAYPTIGVNKFGDILIGCSRFSGGASGTFPTAAYAFHFRTDAAGTNSSAGALKAGEGYYEKRFGGASNRWGDYSTTVVDPVNDADLWTSQEYAATPVGNGDGSGRWGTWWGQIVVSPTAAPATIGGTVTDPHGSPLAGVTMRLAGSQSVTTITEAYGNYSFAGIATDGFYSVTPQLANYHFSPASRSFSLVGNKTDALFTGVLDEAVSANVIDTTEYFVRQQYLDFLGREPDQAGFNYWSDRINQCNGESECIRARRIDVSTAFFVEQEFQQTGSFIYRLYRSALGRRLTYGEYSADRRQVIGGPGLDAGKAAFADGFVQREEFMRRYQLATTAEVFVDALLQTEKDSTGVDLSGERERLIERYQSGATINQSRALLVRHLAESASLAKTVYNESFVLLEYFAYLRREPDQRGYDFWLNVLNNREPGNHLGMVCSFVTSAEYQLRFGPLITRSNAECAATGAH